MQWPFRRFAIAFFCAGLFLGWTGAATGQFGGASRGGGGSGGAASTLEDAGKQITFEFVLIDRGPEQLANEKGKHPSAAEILELEKQGKLGSVQRLKLVTLENVEARLMLGESAPMVTSRSRQGGREGGFPAGFGGTVDSITYTDLGTTVLITARVDKDGSVVANFNVQKSSFAPSAKGAEKPEGQDGTVPLQPRKLVSTVATAARIAPGETIVLGGQQTLTGATPGEMWVLVSVKL